MANPAFVAADGKHYLYFKTRANGALTYGLATATELEGPYTLTESPVTSNDGILEDGTAFHYKGNFYLLTTDNHGENTGIVGGGTLWKSPDGIKFDLADARLGYDRLDTYYGGYDREKLVKIYGADPKMERPKVLMIDAEPAYLYGPSGWNMFGEDRTVCHVMKINPNSAGQ